MPHGRGQPSEGVPGGTPARRLTRGQRDIAVRIGAFLFIGGAAITALALVLPHPPQLDERAYLLDSILQLIAAGVILSLPREWRRKRWVPVAIVAIGILAVTVPVYWNGERFGGAPVFNEFFYVWPALYIGYFFGLRGMIALLALIAVVYAALLAAIDPGGDSVVGRYLVTVVVVVGAAAVMHALRLNVDALLEKLRDAARTDALTMLLNRRGFDERLELEIDRNRRTGEPFALLVGDLDRFKELNDRFGHPAGDTALALVAQALTIGSRSIDTVSRLGGEEFALLLPATDGAGGMEAAERLRAEVARVGDKHSPTISFGVVECPPGGEAPGALLHAADEAMYMAKSAGGDSTVLGGLPAREERGADAIRPS